VSTIVRVPVLDEIRRWDVKHLLGRPWLRPGDELHRFGEIAKARREKNPGGLRYGSIHFDGSVSLRDESTEIAGETWVARPGDIVYSKIDARNGAIAVMPPGLSAAFTNEFPIFDVASAGALMPAFTALLLRTRCFRSQVEALAVGHSGRKRVPPEVFAELRVPVPDEADQLRVVAEVARALHNAESVRSASEKLVSQAAATLLDELGVEYVRLSTPPLAFAVSLSELPRWSTRKGVEVFQGVTQEIAASFPVKRLGSAAQLRRGISKSPENRPADHATPYIRVANIQPGFLDLSDVQQLDVPPDKLDAATLRAGDVLVCRNNSLELVGKAAPWSEEIANCVFDDHVYCVRPNPAKLDSEYLGAYLQTDIARAWFMSEAQITTNLAGIAGRAVTELPIPMPDLVEQQRLGREFAETCEQAAALYAAALRQVDGAVATAEWEIVTGLPIPAKT
jgi:type I restriction enzyme S subunit